MDSGTQHALLLALGWGLLIDVGTIIVRHFNGRIQKITAGTLHGIFLFVVIVISYYGLIRFAVDRGISLEIEPDKEYQTIRRLHVILGWITYLLPIASVYYGLRLNQTTKDSNADSIKQVWYKKMMRLTGWIAYTITKLAVFLGSVFFAKGAYFKLAVFYYICLLFVHLILEYFHKKRLYSDTQIFRKTNNIELLQEEKALLDAINTENKSREEINKQFPDLRWVIYGNKVYNLKNFVHPGGNFIIKQVQGREISRFLHGGQALESTTMEPHRHSVSAFEILEDCCIGTLQRSEDILIQQLANTTQEASNSDEVPLNIDNGSSQLESTRFDHWLLVNKKMEPNNPRISKFDFEATGYKLKTYLANPSSFGKHVLIHFAGFTFPIRPYSLCLALNPENREMLSQAIEYFDSLVSGKSSQHQQIASKLGSSTTQLSLYIREYDFVNGFSKQIHSWDPDTKSKEESHVMIYGPIGRGLELKGNTKGTIYIICAGTGVIPFLDLLHFMLLKTMYKVLLEKTGKDAAEKIRPQGMNFDQVLDGLKVVLIGGFQNVRLGYDIIKNLARINKENKIGNFEAYCASSDKTSLHIEDISETRINLELLSKKVKVEGEDNQRFYICGPPNFNQSVHSDLAELGISKEKLIFV